MVMAVMVLASFIAMAAATMAATMAAVTTTVAVTAALWRQRYFWDLDTCAVLEHWDLWF